MANIQQIGNAKMETDRKLQEFADKKNIVLLAFMNSYVPKKVNTVKFSGPFVGIIDEIAIENALTAIEKKCKKIPNELYLLINTRGGSLNSSFKIAKAIRNTFEKITVFVPHMAASGGTLLALTGNKIRMGPMSQLGPLDPQMDYMDYGEVSANSIGRAKMRLDDMLETLDDDEIIYSDKHMAQSIDPIMYEMFNNACVMTETYIGFILKKSGYKDNVCAQLRENLVYEWPDHDFVIDENLAKEIGLAIELNHDIEEWNLMRNWFSKYISTETDVHFIRYCIPQNIKNN